MATTTPRIGLTKPDGTDLVDIAVLNTNFDKIDSNIASTKIQSTKPTTANAGDLWWDSDTGTLYLYYTDANSSQWVAATSDPINIGVVANQTERDAQYPTPAQGMSVYRTDLGVTQRYYGLFNSSTNPGGRDSAGWYNTEKSVGLVPMRPSSATFVTGTGSVNGLGQLSYSGVTKLEIDGVFSSQYSNYRIMISGATSTLAGLFVKLRQNGVDNVNANNWTTYYTISPTGASGGTNANQTYVELGVLTAAASGSHFDIHNPGIPGRQTVAMSQANWDSGNGITGRINFAMNTESAAWTGFSIYPSSGTMNGTLSVFGYNDK